MKFIVLVLFFVAKSWAIDLVLPLSESAKNHFDVESTEIDHVFAWKIKGVLYKTSYYAPRGGEVIKRVFYHGYLLFTDNGPERPLYKRYVCYNEFRGRVLISVEQEGLGLYEAYFYMANDVLYDMHKMYALINYMDGKIDGLSPGSFLTKNIDSLLAKRGPYGALDIAKTVPGIVYFSVPVANESIRLDIDKIFENILRKSSPYNKELDDEYYQNFQENYE